MNFNPWCGIAVLATGLCYGQNPCGDLTKLRAPTKASEALDRMIQAVGFDPGSIILFTSSDTAVEENGGAMSLTCLFGNGYERWIIYDPADMKTEDARDFVLAHELAHHVNFQTLLGTKRSEQDELRADYYGTEYLVRLKWTKERLLTALGQLSLPSESQHGYPSLEERRTSVINGFNDESTRLAAWAENTVSTPRTRGVSPAQTNSNVAPNPGGTWLDPSTGLMWTMRDNGVHLNWNDANAYCQQAVHLGGYHDWRLPTVKELSGIFDPNLSEPAEFRDLLPSDRTVHIKGYLQLSGWEWSSDKAGDVTEAGHVYKATHRKADFSGTKPPPKEVSIYDNPDGESVATYALCVRGPEN